MSFLGSVPVDQVMGQGIRVAANDVEEPGKVLELMYMDKGQETSKKTSDR